MAPFFVLVGATFAATFLAFAWTMQRRRCARGRTTSDADDSVVGTFYVG